MPIVSVQPTGEVLAALAGVVVGACVGPFAQRGLDEAFGFAVGSRGIGSGADMAQFQSSAQFCEVFRAVAGAVVGHDAGEGDSEGLEVAQGVDERATGAVSGLAGLDASKAYPGVIVDGHMHVFPSGAPGTLAPDAGDPMAGTHKTS